METITRLTVAIRRTTLATLCLIVLVGCHAENSPGNANGHEDDHAGHVIPAHKPRTFPDAVRRLRELNDQFLRMRLEGRPDRRPVPRAWESRWISRTGSRRSLPTATCPRLRGTR